MHPIAKSKAARLWQVIAAIVGGGLITSWVSMAPYYPTSYFFLFSVYLLSVALLTYRGIWPGLILLAVTGPFFGNHPGGRFVEVYNLALLQTPLWALLYTVHKSAPGKDNSIGSGIVQVTAILSILSYSGAYFLLESFEGYKMEPFHFLSSRDWLPHYSILVALLGCALSYSVWKGYSALELSGSNTATLFAKGLLIGPVTVLLIALLEIWIPGVANGLDTMHVRIAGYVDRSHSHFPMLSWLSPLLDTSPNSLFWNRSWLSIYLVSCLPLGGIAMGMARGYAPGIAKRVKLWLLLMLTIFAYVQLVIGSRAALLSTGIFFSILLITSLERLRSRSFLRAITLSVIALAAIVPILSLLDLPRNPLGLRAELFRSGLELITIFPLFGGGAESFGFWNDMLLRAQGYQRAYSSTHNFLLQIGVGYGIAGILAIVGLYLLIFRNLIQTVVKRSGEGDTALPERVALAGMAAIIVYGCFQEWWYIRVVQLNWWLAVLGCVMLFNRPSYNTEDSAIKVPRVSRGRIAAIAIAVAGLAVVQFWSGFTLKERHLVFENVGHLETIPQEETSSEQGFRYPLLAGDGTYLILDGSKIVERPFECEAPKESLTGPPDPRIICEYAPVAPAIALENPGGN